MTDGSLTGRILVAEDDPELAHGLSATITVAGATVIGPVRRVEDALAFLSSVTPDGAVLSIDLDGEVTTNIIVALRMLAVPIVLAMEDVSAYPGFWAAHVPRVARPVTARDLALALERARGLTDPRMSDTPHAYFGRGARLAALVEADGDVRALKRAALVEMEDRRLPPDPALPVVEIDARPWRNELDLYASLGAAVGMPGHSTNIDGWLEIILDGAGFGAVEPPYAIRIVNAGMLRSGVRAAIALLATTLRHARTEWGHNPQADILVVP